MEINIDVNHVLSMQVKMDGMLRVHSSDLHQHIVEQIAECFESGLYTDLVVRCKDGKMIHAHKLVLSAVSPFLKLVWTSNKLTEI